MSSANAQKAGIGDSGELWFACQLPKDWIWQPPRRDVGKDALIVINDRSHLHNIEFSVQVKTTECPKINKGVIRQSGIPRSSVMYWFSSPQPTLIVVVDIKTKRAWYAWHLDLFNSPSEISGKDTCSIRIPTTNSLDSSGWLRIRERLIRHYNGLQAAIHTAQAASKLVPAIHAIATAARDLVWLDGEPDRPTKEDFSSEDHEAIFLLIHDQCSYRDILKSVRSIHPIFRNESDIYKQIQLWLFAFESHVVTAYPDFLTFPETDDFAGLRITFDAQSIRPKRRLLMAAALEMISMLSKG